MRMTRDEEVGLDEEAFDRLRESKALVAREDFFEGREPLCARQFGAEAAVNPVAEGEMACLAREAPVGRGKEQEEDRARGDGGALEGDLTGGRAENVR